MRRLLPLLVLVACATVPAPGRAMTLEDALATVYAEHPKLDAARARLRAADEELPIARSTARPQVQALSSQGAAHGIGLGSGNSALTTRNVLELSQPIYTGGAVTARLRAARAAISGERARLAIAEQDLLLETVRAYATLMQAHKRQELARDSEARHRRDLDAVTQRFRLGDATGSDIAQAESRQARAGSEQAAAAGDLAVAESDFERLVGALPVDMAELTPCPDLPGSAEQAEEDIQTHPTVVAAAAELERSRAGVDLAKSAGRPTLALTGQVGFVQQPGSDLGEGGQAAVSAVVTMPLYQGGGQAARLRQSKQAWTQHRRELDQAERNVLRDIRAGWRSLVAARARLPNNARQLRAAAIALDGVRQEALNGLRSIMDLLDAEGDFYQAQLASLEAEQDVLLAGWALGRALGRLDAGNLGLMVVPYDPDAHLAEVGRGWWGTDEALPIAGR